MDYIDEIKTTNMRCKREKVNIHFIVVILANKINKQNTKKKQHTHRANDEQQGPPKNEHRCL
jgi:ATP adenylyltransferase/5',5'''-P-1,P-4-tetraphosphate phosphorylase II